MKKRPMANQKKGAIELSMTTIIVIVMGITLLVLGLGFIRSIYSNITKISEDTFSKANSMLDNLENVNDPLTLSPNRINIEISKDDVVKIILANQDETDIDLGVRIIPNVDDNKIDCYLYDINGKATKNVGPYKIASGTQKNLALIVKDLDGKIRSTACKILVSGLSAGQDNEGTLLISVTEKKSLF